MQHGSAGSTADGSGAGHRQVPGTETRSDRAPSETTCATAGGEGDQEMRMFLAAATGLPTILLTAALVVVVCFWLLVAVGRRRRRQLRRGRGPSGLAHGRGARGGRLLPADGARLVLERRRDGCWSPCSRPRGLSPGCCAWSCPAGALLVAWATTCLIVRPLHRLFPDEPAPSVLSEARTGGGTGLRGAGSRDPHGGASRDAAPRRGTAPPEPRRRRISSPAFFLTLNSLTPQGRMPWMP